MQVKIESKYVPLNDTEGSNFKELIRKPLLMQINKSEVLI